MCLVLFSYRQRADWPLVFAANRDEFYDRPTVPAAFWDDAPQVLAGRDLQGGGTWCGLTRTGRFAALTNYRDLRHLQPEAPSRGALVADFLRGQASPEAYLHALAPTADQYNGFNLLVGDTDTLWYFSNYEHRVRRLAPGLYGLSHHLLDTPWPKVATGKAALQTVLDNGPLQPDTLFDVLADPTVYPDDQLPDTGVGPVWERILSARFIHSPRYGTRCSTVILVDARGQSQLLEQTFGMDGQPQQQQSFTVRVP
jgi:uncharacterized protein with NRDE domain